VPAQNERQDQRRTAAEDRPDAIDCPWVRDPPIVRAAVPPQKIRKGSAKAETDRRHDRQDAGDAQLTTMTAAVSCVRMSTTYSTSNDALEAR